MMWAHTLAWLVLLSGLTAWGLYFGRKGIWGRLMAKKAKTNKTRWHVEREKMAYYQTQDAEKKMRIMMLGDSLTAQGNWGPLLERGDTINYGIPGETTGDLLERLDDVLTMKPNLVCLMIGINDLVNMHAGAAGVLNRQLKCCEKILSSGCKLLVASLLPTTFDSSVNGMVEMINAGLNAKAVEVGYSFIDLTEDFATGGGLKAELSYDGLHLNITGYKIWASHLSLHLPAEY